MLQNIGAFNQANKMLKGKQELKEQVFTTNAVIVKIDELKGCHFNRCRTCHMKISDGHPHWHCQQVGVIPTPITGGVIMTCFSPEEKSMLPAVNEVLSYTPDPDPHVLPSIIRDSENRKRTFRLHFATCCRSGYPKLILDSTVDAPPPMLPTVPRGAHEATSSSAAEPLAEEIPTEMITPPPTMLLLKLRQNATNNITGQDKDADLSVKIEEGFGPDGLGILSISDVPGYASLRQKLLNLAPRLASLPEEVLKELEDPQSRYNFGWSHGKEKLESGKPDLLKGSFYANPILDKPTTEDSLIQRYPAYCGSNIWPKSTLPELEVAFKALGKLIFDVGLLVAYHCDKYVSKGIDMPLNEGIEQIVHRSRCHKGRLLYYFPAEKGCSNDPQDDDSMSSWCGWHTDHGSLTGLTYAIYTKGGVEIPCPDSTAGLYIKTRAGQIVKVVYEENEIAYQIGNITEILSRGRVCATPHCVRAPKGEKASGLERSTFALFMQPDWDEKLNFPETGHVNQELVQANESLTFGEYTEKLLDKYYHLKK